jgi:hypothetical protein
MLPVENSRTVLFFAKIPKNSNSSPRKFEVPGKLILAKVNAKNAVANSGITETSPP